MTNNPSVSGKGIDIFFGQDKKQLEQRKESNSTLCTTTEITKITFRVPPQLAKEFDELFYTIKKEKKFLTKNHLLVLAIKQLIEQGKKGQLKVDSL